MAQIKWTEPALNDLNDLAEYIAISNPYAAKELVENIFDKIQRLEEFPDSGKAPEEISNLNHREVIVNPCRIFYKVDLETVYILHVMRQERDLRKFLLSTKE